MRFVRLSVFIVLAAFAASLRSRPFSWTDSSGRATSAAAHIADGKMAIGGRDLLRPEALGDALLAAVQRTAGARGLSIFALILFVGAFSLALDAARVLSTFSAASLLAVLFLPFAMGDSAPDPWLFSCLFAMAFLWIATRARRRWAHPATLLFLPVLAAVWPLFHEAGVLLAPFLALTMVVDGLLAWWAAEHAVVGGIFTAPPDPLLFREEDLDMGAFHRVLAWETKMNQFVHQRLGMTPAQLSTLTAARAVDVLNSLLAVPDLPAQAGVPDTGGSDGDVRQRNRRLLDIQYRDALRPPAPEVEAEAPLKPLPLWAPITAAIAALIAVAVPPAGPQAVGRLLAALSGAGSRLQVPSAWWISAPRDAHLAAPYFWVSLVVFLVTGLAGLSRQRDRFPSALFAAGLALYAAVLPAPAAAPLAALAGLVFSAAFLRGIWPEDNTLIRTLGGAAAFLIILVCLLLADWDAMPVGHDLALGAPPSEVGK